MIIPHEGQQIFSLQLNWAMIAFISGIVGSVMFLAALALYYKYQDAYEKQQLMARYGSKLQSTLKLESLINTNARDYKKIFAHLEKLAEQLGISEKELKLPVSAEKAKKKASRDLNLETREKRKRLGPRGDYWPSVYNLRSLYIYAKERLVLLNRISDLHIKGLGIYDQMPLGRPFYSFQGLRDTSGFGKRLNPINRAGSEFHDGYDTAGPIGTPVYATAHGIVHKSYYHPNGYGRTIILEHGFGFYSTYAHLSRLLVKSGERVQKGQKIGAMGSSGRVTGSHLHYEIHQGLHHRVNPKHFICAQDFHTNSCLYYHSRQND